MNGSLILMYHRVAEIPHDPYGLCVSPGHFNQHLQALRRWFRPAPLAAVLAGETEGPSVAVTFDDGYADNLHGALPLLERYNIPATVFVCSGYVGGPREFWWDELEQLLGAARPKSRREKLRRKLHRAMLGLPATQRTACLERLRVAAGLPGECRASHRPLSAEELQRLAGHPLIEVGCHTVSHSWLGGLSPEEIGDEIRADRSRLQGLLGCPVDGFAYPFDSRGLSRSQRRAVEASGVRYALTTRPGLVREETSRYRVPRCTVLNWTGIRWHAQMLAWAHHR